MSQCLDPRVFPALSIALLLACLTPGEARGGYCLSRACHANLMNREYLHGPVTMEKQAQGGCVLCHTPAGEACRPEAKGVFKFEMAWDQLCLTCHGGTLEPSHKLPARPCVICHDPHGSNLSKRLFRKGVVTDQ